MSVLIMSDSHGLTKEVQAIAQRHACPTMLHCGDFVCDRHQVPFSEMEMVRGNCDADPTVSEEKTVEWNGVKIYMTHGHLHGVKTTLMNLQYRAEEVFAGIVLFGHTHIPGCEEKNGVLFLNPGSVAETRRFPKNTYCVLEEREDGKAGKRVEVRYYDTDGQPVDSLGGAFDIRTMHTS